MGMLSVGNKSCWMYCGGGGWAGEWRSCWCPLKTVPVVNKLKTGWNGSLSAGQKKEWDFQRLSEISETQADDGALGANKVPRTLGDEPRRSGSCTGLHVWIGSLIRGLMLGDGTMQANPEPFRRGPSSVAESGEGTRGERGPWMDHGWRTYILVRGPSSRT